MQTPRAANERWIIPDQMLLIPGVDFLPAGGQDTVNLLRSDYTRWSDAMESGWP